MKKNHLQQFRELHVKASGYETRSRKSWECQFDLVKNGEAFIIFGHIEGTLISAALFMHSSRYCFYGVSASDRSLFSKPISHILIWTAIQYAKKNGCLVFDLAGQFFPAGSPKPSKKELQISKFKSGFGGTTNIQILLNLNSNMKLDVNLLHQIVYGVYLCFHQYL